jgi:hypothetical protein
MRRPTLDVQASLGWLWWETLSRSLAHLPVARLVLDSTAEKGSLCARTGCSRQRNTMPAIEVEADVQ